MANTHPIIENVSVIASMQPIPPEEFGCPSVLNVQGNSISTLDSITEPIVWYAKDQHVSGVSNKYNFDRVFGEDSNEHDIFQQCQDRIDDVVDGRHASIICYGDPTSQKTHPFIPSRESKSLVDLAGQRIFEIINMRQETKFSVKFMFSTLHEGKWRNALEINPTLAGAMGIKSSDEFSINNENGFVDVNSYSALTSYIARGCRQGAQTKRIPFSPFVLMRIKVESKEKCDQMIRVGELVFMSVPTEERVPFTNIITNLSRPVSSMVPYELSSHNLLLKRALGGNSRTMVMFCMNSSDHKTSVEIMKVAQRCKTIRNVSSVNFQVSASHLEACRQENDEMVRKIKEMEAQLLDNENQIQSQSCECEALAEINAMQQKKSDSQIQELHDELSALKMEKPRELAELRYSKASIACEFDSAKQCLRLNAIETITLVDSMQELKSENLKLQENVERGAEGHSETISKLTEKLKKMEEENKNLKKEMKEFKQSKMKLDQEFDINENQLQNALQEIADLKTKEQDSQVTAPPVIQDSSENIVQKNVPQKNTRRKPKKVQKPEGIVFEASDEVEASTASTEENQPKKSHKTRGKKPKATPLPIPTQDENTSSLLEEAQSSPVKSKKRKITENEEVEGTSRNNAKKKTKLQKTDSMSPASKAAAGVGFGILDNSQEKISQKVSARPKRKKPEKISVLEEAKPSENEQEPEVTNETQKITEKVESSAKAWGISVPPSMKTQVSENTEPMPKKSKQKRKLFNPSNAVFSMAPETKSAPVGLKAAPSALTSLLGGGFQIPKLKR